MDGIVVHGREGSQKWVQQMEERVLSMKSAQKGLLNVVAINEVRTIRLQKEVVVKEMGTKGKEWSSRRPCNPHDGHPLSIPALVIQILCNSLLIG